MALPDEDESFLNQIDIITTERAEFVAKRRRQERVALTFMVSMVLLLVATLAGGFYMLAKEHRQAERRAYEYWLETERGDDRFLSFDEWRETFVPRR